MMDIKVAGVTSPKVSQRDKLTSKMTVLSGWWLNDWDVFLEWMITYLRANIIWQNVFWEISNNLDKTDIQNIYNVTMKDFSMSRELIRSDKDCDTWNAKLFWTAVPFEEEMVARSEDISTKRMDLQHKHDLL